MKVKVTPPNQGPVQLDLLDEPSWRIAEQGGFQDATIRAVVPDSLRKDLRYAEVEIEGIAGPVYFGHVRTIDGDVISAQGWQSRLEDLRRGACYHTDYLGRWIPWTSTTGYARNQSISAQVEESQMVLTWASGTLYPSGSTHGFEIYLPQATSNASLTFSWAWTGGPYSMTVFRNGSGGFSSAYSSTASSGTTTVNMTDLDYIRITGNNSGNVTPTSDAVLKISSVVLKGTSVATMNPNYILNHILTAAGSVVPDRDVAVDTTALTDIWFDANSTELEKIAYILKYVDFRFYFEPRLVSGIFRPVAVYAQRPTTPSYFLTEDGSSVVCNLLGETAEPLASVVRVMYRNPAGVPRYVDVTDTDTNHYLVHAGITKYASIDADTTSQTLATAAGTRYLVDAGRDQVQGTVELTGSPGGIPASLYKPGEIVRLTTYDRGVVEARITEAQYEGPYRATLTLDNTPNLGDLVFRMNRARTVRAIQRA